MVHFDVLVLIGGLLGYLVSILASTALVFLFFRLNSKLFPNPKAVEFFSKDSQLAPPAPAIALGAATLSQAYLLRHAVFVIMALVQDFLVTYGSALLAGPFPFLPFLNLIVLAALLLAVMSLLAWLSIVIAGAFFNKMTGEIDEMKEIMSGNKFIAILFAFVLFAVTVILNEGIEYIARALIPYSKSGIVSLP
jgi:hypothetical protein